MRWFGRLPSISERWRGLGFSFVKRHMQARGLPHALQEDTRIGRLRREQAPEQWAPLGAGSNY